MGRLHQSRAIAVAGVLLGAVALGACTPASSPSPTAAADLQGLFHANGHNLFLHCTAGDGPTVVLIYGQDGSIGQWDAILPALAAASGKRVCAYDRVNVGLSAKDPGRHTATDSASDLHAMLASAGIGPPYVLVGASFGGLLAVIFAGTYPTDVLGILNLDGVLPIEADLDSQYLTPDQIAHVKAESDDNLEHTENYAAYDEFNALLPSVPAIPVVYLYATLEQRPAEWPAGTYEPAMTAFVAAQPHWTLIREASHHYMQPEIPDEIVAQAVSLLTSVAP